MLQAGVSKDACAAAGEAAWDSTARLNQSNSAGDALKSNKNYAKILASVFIVVWVISGFLQQGSDTESKNLTALKQQILSIPF